MKPFDIELAKQGHPVCTRTGREARFIQLVNNKIFPVVAIETGINGDEHVSQYTDEGRYQMGGESDADLFMKSEKHTGYACFQPIWDGSVYRVPIAAEICETPELARMTSRNPNDIVVKLEWEE